MGNDSATGRLTRAAESTLDAAVTWRVVHLALLAYHADPWRQFGSGCLLAALWIQLDDAERALCSAVIECAQVCRELER